MQQARAAIWWPYVQDGRNEEGNVEESAQGNNVSQISKRRVMETIYANNEARSSEEWVNGNSNEVKLYSKFR